MMAVSIIIPVYNVGDAPDLSRPVGVHLGG